MEKPSGKAFCKQKYFIAQNKSDMYTTKNEY